MLSAREIKSEVADNTWRDGSAALNNTEESFEKSGGISVDQRKMNAVRAYFEWMPIRFVREKKKR
jgi:alkaline phosphatase D